MKRYNQTSAEVLEDLGVSPDKGLGSSEVSVLRDRHGVNQLDEKKPKPLWVKFLENFKEFMVLILLAAAVVSYVLHEKADAYIILAIVILNAVISTIQEAKAEASLAALKELSAPKCIVIRDGKPVEIEAVDLVPGDIVQIEA